MDAPHLSSKNPAGSNQTVTSRGTGWKNRLRELANVLAILWMAAVGLGSWLLSCIGAHEGIGFDHTHRSDVLLLFEMVYVIGFGTLNCAVIAFFVGLVIATSQFIRSLITGKP